MQIKKFLFTLGSLFAVSLPLYADVVPPRPVPFFSESEFYVSRFSWSIDNILALYILIIVFAGCALLGACVLTWKEHEYNVPRQKKWYEWLISIVILFAPYLILFPDDKLAKPVPLFSILWQGVEVVKSDLVVAWAVVLCTAVGLVYELVYVFVMNREEIRNGRLRHWASIEYLMIIACYSSVLLYRMLFFPGGGLSVFRFFHGLPGSVCFFIEYLVFWGVFFFFYLHRQKHRWYCYVLLHFCTVTGLIALFTCYLFLFDGFTKMRVDLIKQVVEKEKRYHEKPNRIYMPRHNPAFEDSSKF